MKDHQQLDERIKAAEKELAALDEKRKALKEYIAGLRHAQNATAEASHSFQPNKIRVTNESSEKDKIALFRSLFRGREDVFPKRFKVSALKRAVIILYVLMSGSNPFARSQKPNVVNAKRESFHR